MEKQQLLDKLAALQAELATSDTGTLDDQSRERLSKVTDDLQRILDREGAEQSEEDDEGLSGEVQDLVLKFEADHPQLTSALNQVAAALANLGI